MVDLFILQKVGITFDMTFHGFDTLKKSVSLLTTMGSFQ